MGAFEQCLGSSGEDKPTLESKTEPEPHVELETVELDLAAVAAAGVDLLPEMSDDWMAAFRS